MVPLIKTIPNNKNRAIIIIIGFDDIFIASASHPTLSTIRQDTDALAKTASELLLNLMNEENTEELQKRYILPVEVIKRESTAN